MLNCAFFTIVICSLSGLLMAQSGQFLSAPQSMTGHAPLAVAAGDFNGDGKTDLAIANSGSNTVTVLIGNGGGSTFARKDYATGSVPLGIVAGDFNGDGNLDLALANSASNTISVLLGNGDGTFRAKVDYAAGAQPQGLAVGDFNGDGKLDLAVTDSGSNAIGILLGNGDGTFGAETEFKTGVNPVSVAVGDFNGDGKPDLAVANGNNNDVVSILLGNGDGSFQGQLEYATGGTPVAIVIEDFNGDGKLDLATADQTGNAASVLLGKGDGSFLPHTDYAVGLSPTSIAVADFRVDGRVDLAVTNGDGNTVSVLLGNGDGTFQPRVDVGTGNIPSAVVAADLNGDGKPDLAVANSVRSSVSTILGNGDGSFQTRVDYAVDTGADPHSVAVADFNGDGRLDLAVVDSGDNAITVLLGNGDGSFEAGVDYSTGTQTNPYAVVVGDFNGDGKPDLAVADYNSNGVGILVGNGDGTFRAPTNFPTATSPCSIAVGDFNGDRKPDLVVTDFNSNTVSVLIGNGDGTFKAHVDYRTGNNPVSVALGDFNGDGYLDLVVVNESDNSAGVMLGNGDGTFQAPVFYSTGSGGNPAAVAVADFNGDGKLDFAVADLLLKHVSVFLGNGDGTFGNSVDYPTGNNPISVATTDLNARGVFDLVLASSAGNTAMVLLGNGDGTFEAPELFPVGTGPAGLQVGDFNGDGLADAVLVNSISNSVSILLNSRGVATSVQSSSNPASFGQVVQFTVTVAEGLRGAGMPTGTVTITKGSAIIASGPLVNGQFSTETNTLSVGENSLSVMYSGDTNFEPRTTAYTETIQKAGSNTVLGSSPNPSTLSQTVTLTATVTSTTSGIPTGTVNFMDAMTLLGTVGMNGIGVAIFSTSALIVGTHNLSAVYSGDSSFAASTSQGLNQVVQQLGLQGFELGVTPTTMNVTPGSNASATISVTGQNGFAQPVTLACASGLPPMSTCQFSYSTVTPGTKPATSTLTITTTGPTAVLMQSPVRHIRYAILLLMPAILLGSKRSIAPKPKWLNWCVVLLVMIASLGQIACGGGQSAAGPKGGGTSGTPMGSYNITITGTSGAIQSKVSLSLTVQ